MAKPIIAFSKYLAVQVHARFERPTEGFHFQTFIRLCSWSSCSVSARRHQHQTAHGGPQVNLALSCLSLARRWHGEKLKEGYHNLFYSLIDPFGAEPLTLVFHLPIQIPTWPSTGKTFSAPRNQHLWAGRQKRRWLHSWERDQHRHHFPSPEMSLCGDNRRLFICDHCCPTLLTSEWPIPTDCSMLKESFEKSQRWNSVLLVDLVWFDKGKG